MKRPNKLEELKLILAEEELRRREAEEKLNKLRKLLEELLAGSFEPLHIED